MTASISPASVDAEADAERARAGLVTTLDQLRENLQPANVVEEVMSSAGLSASALSDQIWETARRNPLPAVMIGAGLAMILGLGGRAISKSQGLASSAAPVQPSQFGSQITRSQRPGLAPVSPSLDSASNAVKVQAGHVLDVANNQLVGAVSKVASVSRNVVSTIKPAGGTMSFTRSSDTLLSGITKVIEEQPLVLAAIGIAVGAAIGTAIPQTDAENSLLGESSHSVRDAAQGLVTAQYEQLKSSASKAVDDVKQSVADHGLTSENLSGLVGDVAEKAKSATYEAGRTLDPTKA